MNFQTGYVPSEGTMSCDFTVYFYSDCQSTVLSLTDAQPWNLYPEATVSGTAQENSWTNFVSSSISGCNGYKIIFHYSDMLGSDATYVENDTITNLLFSYDSSTGVTLNEIPAASEFGGHIWYNIKYQIMLSGFQSVQTDWSNPFTLKTKCTGLRNEDYVTQYRRYDPAGDSLTIWPNFSSSEP